MKHLVILSHLNVRHMACLHHKKRKTLFNWGSLTCGQVSDNNRKTGISPNMACTFFACVSTSEMHVLLFSGLIAAWPRGWKMELKTSDVIWWPEDSVWTGLVEHLCVYLYDVPWYTALLEGILPRYKDNGSSCLTARGIEEEGNDGLMDRRSKWWMDISWKWDGAGSRFLCSLDWAGPPQYLNMFGVFVSTFAWVIVCRKCVHLFLSAFSLALSLSLSLPCPLSRSFSLSRSWPLRRLWSRSRLRLLRPPRLLLPDLLWRKWKGGGKNYEAHSAAH